MGGAAFYHNEDQMKESMPGNAGLWPAFDLK